MFINSSERTRVSNINRFNSAGYACHSIFKVSKGTWDYDGINRVFSAAQNKCAKKNNFKIFKNSNNFDEINSENSSDSENQASLLEKHIVPDKRSALAL